VVSHQNIFHICILIYFLTRYDLFCKVKRALISWIQSQRKCRVQLTWHDSDDPANQEKRNVPIQTTLVCLSFIIVLNGMVVSGMDE